MSSRHLFSLLAFILAVMVGIAVYLIATGLAVHGTVTDATSGEPLAGVTVRVGTVTTQTDSRGAYSLAGATRGRPLTFVLDGYHTGSVSTVASWFSRQAVIDVALHEVTLDGVVLDAVSALPVPSAAVSLQGETVVTSGDGTFRFTRVRRSASIQVRADGYDERTLVYSGEDMLPIALTPNTVAVRVVDEAGGAHIPYAELWVDGQPVQAAGDHFLLQRVTPRLRIEARADGYEPVPISYRGGPTLVVSLSANLVTGLVRDQRSGEALAAVSVTLKQTDNTRTTRSTGAGEFQFRHVRSGAVFTIESDDHAPAVVTYTGQTRLDVSLRPDSLRGVVYDQENARPLSAVTVTLQPAAVAVLTDDQGRFQFNHVGPAAAVAVAVPGYLPAVVTYTGQLTSNIALQPTVMAGVVRDLYTGQALKTVTVTLQQADRQQPVETVAGAFQVRRLQPGDRVTVAGPEHAPVVVTYTGQMSVEIFLQPNVVRGVVREAATGQPVAGATVTVGSQVTNTAGDGSYAVSGVEPGQPVVVAAGGYDKARLPIPGSTTVNVALQPFAVRGIYIPFYLLTIPKRVAALIDFADHAGMNAIVVDIKGDDGYLAYKSGLPLAKEIGAPYAGSMMSLADVLALAKQRGMYTIARQVVFKDNVLALARPDLAVQDRNSKQVWDDCGNGSTYWADPFRKEVVEYNAAIAEEVARLGFDEVQFDYIRFPPACISGARLAAASYAVTPTVETRVAAIETFLAEAQRRLKPLGVAISVDTFGWTLGRTDDVGIGQRLENMAKYVDYISPMVYPSTWEPGALGFDYPPAHPYGIVYESIKRGMERIKNMPGVKMRPWLQDFDDYQHRELPYGVKELDEQRRGAADAGAVGWMLWNAGGVYTEETVPRR